MTQVAVSDSERPQDVGRSHKRGRRRRPEDVELLDRWHAALRRDLGRILDELDRGAVAADELEKQRTLDGSPMVAGLDVKRAGPLYDLGIRLAKELGSAIDPAPDPQPASGSSRPRSRKVAW